MFVASKIAYTPLFIVGGYTFSHRLASPTRALLVALARFFRYCGGVLTVMDASENIGSVLNESAVNKAVANIAVVGENAKILSAFDISLLLDGKKVQPNGMVKVKIPMPENSDRYEQLTVVYIEDDGSVTKLVTTVTDDGMFEFETGHFSLYAIVGVSRSNAFNPVFIIIPALVIFLAAGAVIIVTIRKKKAQ